MFKVNNKNTITMSFSIVDFKKVNVSLKAFNQHEIARKTKNYSVINTLIQPVG